jgi:hypothetical protein
MVGSAACAHSAGAGCAELSVLTMLWLRASSTRRSSAELPSALVKDDRPNGDGRRENSVGSSSASSSVLSTNPSQISRSPSRELEWLLKDRREKGRRSASLPRRDRSLNTVDLTRRVVTIRHLPVTALAVMAAFGGLETQMTHSLELYLTTFHFPRMTRLKGPIYLSKRRRATAMSFARFL